ncbi:MAG: DUF6524 family protein [Xanthomonadales bacterium]|nr:DUF6524 family protein [Xanthomonadales bacterium]
MSNEKHARSPRKSAFGFTDFLVRLGAALVLVLLSYNPSGWSCVHWIKRAFGASELGPLHFLAGAVLLGGWTIFIVATRRSLGDVGLWISAAILAALVWLLVDIGWLGFDSVEAVSWVLLVCLSVLLALGLSWSHVWRRLSGQLEVDDND